MRFRVRSATFTSGTTETFPTSGVTVVVGPNNVGKSAFLRQLTTLIGHRDDRPMASSWLLQDIDVEQAGSTDEVWEFLKGRGAVEGRDHSGDPYLILHGTKGDGHNSARTEIDEIWSGHRGLQGIARFFVATQMADERLALTSGQALHDLDREVPQAPLQRLFLDNDLEQRLSALTHRAFGFELSLNRYVQQLQLRVGKPQRPLTPPPASPALLEEYGDLRLVDQEGDGVRAFVGLLLHLLAPGPPVVVVDEPEAFLHPPQARLLGRLLVEESPSDGQVFIATHSADVLQGVLDSRKRETKIIRLDRVDGETTVSRLDPEGVRRLWAGPLIRYSNLLAGIFHRGTVVCEGDADCRFYAAVLDHHIGDGRSHDLLFTQVGGKGRLGKAINALRTFSAKVSVIADFDLLEEERHVKAVAEAAGINWSLIGQDYRVVANGAKDKWRELRNTGVRGLPQGDAQAAATRLLGILQAGGIFVVPVGELERWAPDLPKNGWIVQCLENGRHESPSGDLVSFVEELAAHFEITSSSKSEEVSRSEADP